jgi:large subunit ribosomal protein L17
MEHKVGNRKLQRDTAHRLAMLKNMVTSLIEHERIVTTVPKAKEARKMAEKVITLGKKGGLNNVRLAQKIVKDRVLLQKIFGELKTRYATRKGGYTRLMRGGFRKGDAADIAILELMDRPEAAPAAPEAKDAKVEEKKP